MDPVARLEALRHDAEWRPIRLYPEPGRVPTRTKLETRRWLVRASVATAVVAVLAGGLTWFGVSSAKHAVRPPVAAAPVGTPTAQSAPSGPDQSVTVGGLTIRVPVSFQVVTVPACSAPNVTYKPGITGIVKTYPFDWGAVFNCPAEPAPGTPVPTPPPVGETLGIQPYSLSNGNGPDGNSYDPTLSGKALNTVSAAGQSVVEVHDTQYGDNLLLLVFTKSRVVVSVQAGQPSDPLVSQLLSTAMQEAH